MRAMRYASCLLVVALGFRAMADEGMWTYNNFPAADVKKKYGASTTWMGKLLFRLNAGRNGGCPVLVFGITPKLVTDWKAP